MSQTLDRGLHVLVALGDGPKTINDVAQELTVHHSTALRLLHTLERRRFVTRQNGTYQLGPRVAWLGQLVLDQLDLRALARPYIETLNGEVGETVHLATLVDSEVVYVDKVESTHPVRMYSQVGKTAPLHATGVAKAILAHNPMLLAKVESMPEPYFCFTDRTRTTFAALSVDIKRGRRDGFLLDDREHEDSIHCIAAPIYGSDGTATSAVSVAVPVHRCDRSRLLSFDNVLAAAARGISEELGYIARDTT